MKFFFVKWLVNRLWCLYNSIIVEWFCDVGNFMECIFVLCWCVVFFCVVFVEEIGLEWIFFVFDLFDVDLRILLLVMFRNSKLKLWLILLRVLDCKISDVMRFCLGIVLSLIFNWLKNIYCGVLIIGKFVFFLMMNCVLFLLLYFIILFLIFLNMLYLFLVKL